MHPGQLDVVCRIPADVLQFLVGERPLDARGGAQGQHPRGDLRPRCHDAARGDDRLTADHRLVENDGADADQAQVRDGAGVPDHPVTDGDARPDPGAEAPVGHVDDRQVLDVRLLADLDPLLLAANHATVPDAGAVAEHHAASDRRGRSDEDLATQPRSMSVHAVDHHAFSRWPACGGGEESPVGPSATFFIFSASPRFTFSSASANALTSWLSMSRLRRRPAPATSTEAESAERMRTICVYRLSSVYEMRVCSASNRAALRARSCR